MPATKTQLPSQKADADALAGAKAGAKARRRESAENEDHLAAVLQVEKSGRAATWTRTFRAGTNEDGTPDRRQVTMRETARREVGGAELLRLVNEAVRLAAGRLRARHGIPELSPDEKLDLSSELVTRLLADHKGELPARDKLTKSYLVQRAAGIVLDDPERANIDADGEVTPESIAADAESMERAKSSAHDPMLNQGIDGTWPEVAAACATAHISDKAARAAAYLVAGGTVREDWALTWQVSPTYAAVRVVPEGTAKLRELLSALRDSPLYMLIQSETEGSRDDLDAAAALRREIERGLATAQRPARKVMAWRERYAPGDQAGRLARDKTGRELAVPESPVESRTDKRIIVRSDRTRAKAAQRGGWTASPR